MEDFVNETISENITPLPESVDGIQEDNTDSEKIDDSIKESGNNDISSDTENDADAPSDSQSDTSAEIVGGNDTLDDGNEESGNNDTSGDSEAVADAPSDSQFGASDEAMVSGDSPAEAGTVLPDEFRQALDGMNSVAERIGNGTYDFNELMESVRSLVDVISAQTEETEETYSAIIPISGYRDYDYPITVTWEVSPSAVNAQMQETRMYYTLEEFEEGYRGMCDLVGVTLHSFRILRIQDCSDAEYVYNADSVQEEPEVQDEEEPEEPDTFQEDVLAALADLHEDLQTDSYNDTLFWEQYTAMQEQYVEMQEQNKDLQYHLLASNIAIGFVLLLTLGYTVAHGFLQRMKVG